MRWRRIILLCGLFAAMLFALWILFGDGVLRDLAASRYVHGLGPVDEIEICSLGRETPPNAADLFDYADAYGVVARKTVRGAETDKIAVLWRSLSTGEHRAMCLDPAYGLRFRYQGREILKTSVCWECEGVVLPTLIGGSVICGFDAHSESALTLLEVLQKHVPLPASRIQRKAE